MAVGEKPEPSSGADVTNVARGLILGTLLLFAAGAWLLLARQAVASEAMGPTGGMGRSVFLVTWVVMMVAMMFPTAAPMVLTFARVQGARRAQARPYVPSALFVGSYLVVWAALGVVAYGAAAAAGAAGEHIDAIAAHGAQLGGLVLIGAGIYQLTPLKSVCLAQCRTPLEFVLGRWRDGNLGAVHMGVEHAWYCAGCCWALFALLFPLGVMNVGAMALVTVLIFAEKSLPRGRQIGLVAAVAMSVFGVLVLLEPSLLPTSM